MKKIMVVLFVVLFCNISFSQVSIPSQLNGSWTQIIKYEFPSGNMIRKVNHFCKFDGAKIEYKGRLYKIKDTQVVDGWRRFDIQGRDFQIFYLTSFHNLNEKWLFSLDEKSQKIGVVGVYSTETGQEKFRIYFSIR